MKRINLPNRILIDHLKYCIGKFDEKTHGNAHQINFSNVNYLKKRPYGKICKYIAADYPKNYYADKSINISKGSRILLAEFLKEKFKKIIISKPKKLLELEDEMYKQIMDSEGISLIKTKELTTDFLKYIFNYDSFSQEDYLESEWSAYKYTMELNHSVCVYCNSQFTHTIYKKDGDETFKIRPALDHLLAKTNHPLFSLSVYNLIPACNTCNSGIKGADEVSIDSFIHPYLEDLDELGVFKREFQEGDQDYYSQIVGRNENYEIKFLARKKTDNKRIAEYDEMFGIENRYAFHKKFLNRQIVLALMYNEVYLRRLDISYKDIFFDAKMVKDILFLTDINNTILSKLQTDVTREVILKQNIYLNNSNADLYNLLKEN
ncbi:hypothetical protein [Lysinibacillus tabacifolii]|uniref:HNH endonuclease n=1 Tax=Lysinibacillus tabacifolii TaxID=1173107 RepID=A0ABY2SVN3_9BACI|nr:hypothetical protein [Lysinibacillus tabacifolii]TKI47378.1 hypothetical protein FC748_06830 [Lysinibacillus tabacifolii]